MSKGHFCNRTCPLYVTDKGIKRCCVTTSPILEIGVERISEVLLSVLYLYSLLSMLIYLAKCSKSNEKVENQRIPLRPLLIESLVDCGFGWTVTLNGCTDFQK